MSDDAKFDDLLRREAKGYRSAGEPPADEMWARIEHDVASAIQRPKKVMPHWPWLAAAAGIAAALVVGVAIGRRSVTTDGTPGVPPATASAPTLRATPADSLRDAQMRAVTMSHLVQAEVFLTEVRSDLTTGRHDPERGERSLHLLARTRLLMGNDAARAPAVERLLEDLELVLAEIAALPDSNGHRSVQKQLLDERLRVGTVLPRIRTILPAPPSAGGP